MKVKNKINLVRPRVDCILIWGHGMKYFKEIISEIEQNEYFEILKIIKHIPKSQKHLVREVYSYDYAPFEHLVDKTKYLKRVDKEVCFILIKNLNPMEDLYGKGEFRHIESVTLKNFKEYLRDKFNPYENGIRSHNHILHACDNQTQTHYLLKYLGYKTGLDFFKSDKNFFNIPNHISTNNSFSIINVDYNQLFCKIAVGDSWNKYSLREMQIKETPHYKSIIEGNSDAYEKYLMKFIGGPIKDYNSPKKYELLKHNYKYLDGKYYNSFVVVKKQNEKYLLLDGLHRCSLHFFQGNNSITACLIN